MKITRRALLLSAAVVALAVPAVGASTGALLTNSNANTPIAQTIDTKFRTLSSSPHGANEAGAAAAPSTLVSPDGQYVAYIGTGASGKVVVFRTADIASLGSAATPYRTITGLTGSTTSDIPACFSTDSTQLFAFAPISPSADRALTLATGAVVSNTLSFRPTSCAHYVSYVAVGDFSDNTIRMVAISTMAANTSWSATPTPGAVSVPLFSDGTDYYSVSNSSVASGQVCKFANYNGALVGCFNTGHEIGDTKFDISSGRIYMVGSFADLDVVNTALTRVQWLPFSGTAGLRVSLSGDKKTVVVWSDAGCPVLDLTAARQTALLPSCGAVAAGVTDPTVYYVSDTTYVTAEKW